MKYALTITLGVAKNVCSIEKTFFRRLITSQTDNENNQAPDI